MAPVAQRVSPQWIAQRAQAMGLPQNAVMRVGNQEGLSGSIGDGGHAFGPFQMNNAGGVLTGKFAGQSPQQINDWAWSPKGVNYALAGIQKAIGQGHTGPQAIHDIVYNFERPADKEGEYSRALAQGWNGGGAMAPTQAGQPGGTQRTAGLMQPQQGLQQPQGSPVLQSLLSQSTKMLGMQNSPMFAGLAKAFPQLNAEPRQGGANPAALGTPAGQAMGKVTGNGFGASLVKTARTQLGIPYTFGGQAKLGSSTDCSGLIQATYAAHGVNIPRTTYDQWKTGKAVPLNDLQPGDALYFHMGPNGPEHVGMYVGNGSMIEDPHTGDVVKIQDLSGYDKPVGARRFHG